MWVLPLLLIFLITFSSPIKAWGYCTPHDEMVKELKRQHNEVISYRALNGRGAILEVAVSPDGGFTIIVTHITSMSCVIAEGIAWEILSPPMGEPA